MFIIKHLRSWYRSMPIKYRINLIFMLTTPLLLVAVVTIVYRVSASIMIDKSIDNTLQSIRLVSVNLNGILSEAESYTNFVTGNKTIQDILSRKDDGDGLRDYSDYTQIMGVLDGVVAARTLFESILILDLRGRLYDSGKIQNVTSVPLSEYEEFWQQDAQHRKKWIDTHRSNYTIKEHRQDVITYAKTFYNYNTGKPLGVIFSNIREDTVTKTYANIALGDTGRIFIVNTEGAVISCADKGMLYESISKEPYFPLILDSEGGETFYINGNEHLVVYSRYERADWIIVGIVPTSELIKENSALINSTMLILVAGILVLGILVFAISHSITKPIVRLKETVGAVSEGDMEVRAQVFYNDEVGSLAEAFNSMLEHTSELMDRLVNEQKQKRQYEFSLLQSQLNPHFLYNTLENICGLAELERNVDIINMVGELAAFYRGVLSGGNVIVPIRDELEITKRYLNILKMTYQGKLEYSIEVDHELLDSPTVKLLLQPLAENSVQHGIKYKRGGGTIKIRGWRENDDTFISVSDDGAGIPPEQLECFLSNKNDKFSSKSFGLRSTDKRIKMYFGENSGLSISSDYGKGTTVTVRLSKNEHWGWTDDPGYDS